jgi:hypothetical protein
MGGNMSLKSTLLATALLGFAGVTHAGVVIKVQNENVSDAAAAELTTIKIDGNRMRTDTGAKTSMIFLGETDEMYVMDHSEKTYMVMDRETMEAMAAKMSEAMKQMEAALANAPPEQREMMEKMMRGRMKGMPSSAPRAEPVVTSLGQGDTVSGIGCDWKQMSRDDVVELKACVGEFSDFPASDDLRQISMEMREFVSSITDAMSSMTAGPMGALAGGPMNAMVFDGFPLISENYRDGNLTHRSRLQSVEEGSISSEELTPPSGYKKQDIKKMMR